MTRRLFVGVGLMAGAAAERTLVLEAIAAQKMPHRLVVRGVARAEIFEVRDYGSRAPRCSIEPVWKDGGRFLFAFGSLEERERAWREARVEGGEGLREISVYRCV